MAGISPSVTVDSRLKTLRRVQSRLAWLRIVLSPYRVLSADSQSQIPLDGETNDFRSVTA